MNFHDPITWENYDAARQGELRFIKLKEMIPKGTETVLDVGCGNGLITNKLHEIYITTAMDISEAALQSVQCPKVQASITQIPFENKSFDLVNCNEVIEHLTDDELNLAINELKRVARKHVVISVPHQEQLARLYYKCADCGHHEHPYGHLQSFSETRLANLMEPEFFISKRQIYGPKERDILPVFLHLKQIYLKQWFSPYSGCVCSNCGSQNFLTKHNPLTKVLNGLNLLLVKPRPYWYMALFTKKAGIE